MAASHRRPRAANHRVRSSGRQRLFSSNHTRTTPECVRHEQAVEVKAFSSTEETSPARGHRSRPSVLSVPQSWPCRRSAATDRGLGRRAGWQPPPQRCRASASQPGRGLVLRAGHATRRRWAGTEGVHLSDDLDRLHPLSVCAGHPLRTGSVDGTYTSRSLVPGLGFVPRDGGRPFAAPGDPHTGRVAPPPACFTPHHPGSDVTRPRLPVLTPRNSYVPGIRSIALAAQPCFPLNAFAAPLDCRPAAATPQLHSTATRAAAWQIGGSYGHRPLRDKRLCARRGLAVPPVRHEPVTQGVTVAVIRSYGHATEDVCNEVAVFRP